MKISQQFIIVAFIGALLVFSGIVQSQSTDDNSMQRMIESAKTKADHETIASIYEAEAKSFEAKANEHKTMATAYKVMPGKGGNAGFVAHCKRLVAQYEEAARENLELARLHCQFALETGN